MRGSLSHCVCVRACVCVCVCLCVCVCVLIMCNTKLREIVAESELIMNTLSTMPLISGEARMTERDS